MMRGHVFAGRACCLLAGPALATALAVQPAPADEANDLREFRIGLHVEALPRSGYRDLSCAATPSPALSGWQDFASCPLDGSGLHAVRFRYDEAANPLAGINDRYEGTKVGGHPVILSLLINESGRLDGIRIETDPQARLYLRKKAFLLGPQARERYGPEGWSCQQGQPGEGEHPVGGVFVKEHCEKTTATRHYALDRTLLRRADQDLKDFVSSTRLTISGISGQ